MAEMSSIVQTLEGIRDAVRVEDQDEGVAAATVLLLQFEETFGHDPRIRLATWPLLEQLRMSIESRDFEQANVLTLAFLAKFRSVAGRRGNSGA